MQNDIDKTRQGKGRTVPQEQWDYRFGLKRNLHKLNAKGHDNQVVIGVDQLTGE
jgi:hypothetical protein